MLGRLQSSLLQRYSLQCLESRFHTACSLMQGDGGGPTADSHPKQRSRQPSSGGPNKQRTNPRSDGPASDRLHRPNWGGSHGSDGPARGGGSFRQQRGGGAGSRRNNNQGGPSRQHQQQGGGGKQNILEAALGPRRSGGPKTGAAAIMQVINYYFLSLNNCCLNNFVSINSAAMFFSLNLCLQYLMPTAINSDLLPIADYILKPQVAPSRPSRWPQRDGRGGGNFNRGDTGPNPRVQAAKLRNVLLRSPNKVSRVIQKQIDLDSDPNYRIEDVFASSSLASPSSSSPSPEEILDSFKNDLTSMLGLSEDEFERYKQEAIAVFTQDTLPNLEQQDPRVKEQELEKLLDTITQEHQHYEAIVAKFRVLQSNPAWPHEKKVVFAKRLLKHLS